MESMGARDLPDPLTHSFPLRASCRWLGALAVSLLTSALVPHGGALRAQGAQSRDFEQAFLARREAEIDRAFGSANKKLREDALLPLHRAIDIRPTPVLNGERSKLLAEALAVLRGLAYHKDDKGEIVFEDARSYADFCWRFDFWLLALPEVVDPQKSQLDQDRAIEIFRGRMPDLESVVGPMPRLKDNRIHITARGVFGLPKPKDLRLTLGFRQPGGETLAQATRKDSEDPGGWRVFDLERSFPVDGYGAGYYEAFADLIVDGRKPRDLDPEVRTRFAIRPGFYRDLWTLFSWRKRLSEKMAKAGSNKTSVRPQDLARLDALTMELYRVFVLGKEYGFRPWTLESMDEALALLETLLADKTPRAAPVGDRVYGVRLKDGKSLPVRLIHGQPDAAGHRRATIWFAPLYWDKDWAVDGLGLPPALFQRPGEVHVFLYHQPQKGYLEGIQQLLRQDFGVEPAQTRVVGVQGGVTRARFSLPLLAEPPQEFVWIGSSVGPVELSDEGIPVRVFPALGLPSKDQAAKWRKSLAESSKAKAQLVIEGTGLRSLGEALRAYLSAK